MAQGLTPQLISQFKQTFSMFDVDGDGCITVNQLRTVMKKLGNNVSEDELQIMVNQMDKDGNGTIQLNQFLDMMAKQYSLVKDDDSQLGATFKLFDKNGDGLISAEELKGGLQALGKQKIKLEDIQQLMAAADIDGDGYINYEEFCQMLKFK